MARPPASPLAFRQPSSPGNGGCTPRRMLRSGPEWGRPGPRRARPPREPGSGKAERKQPVPLPSKACPQGPGGLCGGHAESGDALNTCALELRAGVGRKSGSRSRREGLTSERRLPSRPFSRLSLAQTANRSLILASASKESRCQRGGGGKGACWQPPPSASKTWGVGPAEPGKAAEEWASGPRAG